MHKNAMLPVILVFLQIAAPGPAPAAGGKALFEEHCAVCHTIGGGDSVGPDLKGVVKRRNTGWLGRMITEPDKLTAENDTDHSALIKKYGLEMPNLGISPESAREILEYVAGADNPAKAAAGAGRQAAAVKRAGAALKGAAQEAKPAGSAANGGKLFFGTKKLSAGGPACAGCHSNAPGNMRAGGSFAVSLSKVFEKLGARGIKAVLTSLPFPVKAAAFKGRPVTEAEMADLAAFLEEAGKAAPEQGAGFGKFVFTGLAGVVCAFVLIALVWSGRKRKGVKDDILSRQAETF